MSSDVEKCLLWHIPPRFSHPCSNRSRWQLPKPSSAWLFLPGSRVPAHTTPLSLTLATLAGRAMWSCLSPPGYSEQHTHTHTEHANGCTPSVLVSRAFLKGLKRIVSSAKGPLQRLEDTNRRDQLHFRTFIAELAAYKDCLQTLRESLLKDNLTPTPESFSGSMLAAACTPLWKRPSL